MTTSDATATVSAANATLRGDLLVVLMPKVYDDQAQGASEQAPNIEGFLQSNIDYNCRGPTMPVLSLESLKPD